MDLIDQAHSVLQSYVKPRGIKILSLLSFLYLATKSIKAVRSLHRTFLPSGHKLAQRYGQGSWALITGGAQGIGAAYALELASKGFSLILIDMDEQKLTETKNSISSKFSNIQIKTITCNFSESWKQGFYDSLMKEVEGLDISILVNNVGTGLPPGPIYDVPEAEILNTITVNILPMTVLTRRLIPLMLNRPKRSAIINMASITGVAPTPWIAAYSATKAFVDFFTRAIERDVSPKIDVISVRPSAVSTAMIRSPALSHSVVSAQDVAKAVLGKVGKVPYAHGHWKHEIAGWLGRNSVLQKLGTRYFFSILLKMPNYK